jgi:hypothetical protein
MITSKGLVLLTPDSLTGFNSPTISVSGQSSTASDPGKVYVSLNIRNEDGTSATTGSMSLDTAMVKGASDANKVSGGDLIDNLYAMLEQLLKAKLEEINPGVTFEIA